LATGLVRDLRTPTPNGNAATVYHGKSARSCPENNDRAVIPLMSAEPSDVSIGVDER
jgi:hypothetical protein